MIIHPNFDPIAFSAGPLSIHWYGLMYLVGFAVGGGLGWYRAAQPNSGWHSEEILDFIFYISVGVIIGGRMGYVVFYNLLFYLSDPLSIISIWDGGMSFHGGLLGVVVALYAYAKKTHRSIYAVADFLAPLCIPGLGFGRLGNFINQELWGRASDAPWAVLFHTMPDTPRHPSQLYEFALEGVVLFIIVWYYSSRPRPVGRVCGVFLLGYGCFRFFVEFFRQPDAHLGAVALDWMTMGQLLSLPMILAGLYFFMFPRVR